VVLIQHGRAGLVLGQRRLGYS
ncbi:cytochrome C assembly family protein, partial [Vibrio parahaemolyticus V-223/04]